MLFCRLRVKLCAGQAVLSVLRVLPGVGVPVHTAAAFTVAVRFAVDCIPTELFVCWAGKIRRQLL